MAVRIAVSALAIFIAGVISASAAQSFRPPPRQPIPDTSAAVGVSSAYTLFDLSTRYLQLLGGIGGPSYQGGLFGTGPNPGGGGGPALPAPPTYRSWAELYGVSANTSAQGASFPGDARRTYGGVAGVAMNVAPNAMLGLSLDQSRTRIDIVGLPQHATLDLTQVGVNGAYEMGAWTFSGAAVAGFAGIDSSRTTTFAAASASYSARLWGVIGEASYYIPLGSARVVPKFGADWTQTHTDPYAETGGFDAAMVPSGMSNRGRIFLGAEVGNTFVTSSNVIDVSAYAKAVDILFQRVPALTVGSVNGLETPATVFGVTESKYGLDTGAMASFRLSPIARLYLVYDGKFREGFQSQGGTLGVEFRW